jgi:hypothetical protein
MTFFRRFFDAVATDAPGIAPPNIAQLLASKGVQTEGESPVEVPAITIEEPKPQQAGQQPKVTEGKAETATKEAPKPGETPAAPPAPEKPADKPAPTVQPAPVATDWKEVLKNHPNHAEVLKALGYDDKIVGFFQKWKGGEDIKAYLEAATLDYSKWSPEELMKRQLQREFPEIEGADFEELYRMKVIEQYKLDPDIFSEQEVRRGKILLQADARKHREQFVKEQQDFLLPKAPEADPQVEQARQEAMQREQEVQKQIEQYRAHITDHSLTKDLRSTKMLSFGQGEEAFKYEVAEPEKLLDLVFDNEKIAAKLFDEKDGQRTPNVWKHLAIAAILDDDVTLFTNLANHYKKVGAKNIIAPIENASVPGAPMSRDNENSDPIAALARAGVITGG